MNQALACAHLGRSGLQLLENARVDHMSSYTYGRRRWKKKKLVSNTQEPERAILGNTVHATGASS